MYTIGKCATCHNEKSFLYFDLLYRNLPITPLPATVNIENKAMLLFSAPRLNLE